MRVLMARLICFAVLAAVFGAAWASPAGATRLALGETMTTTHFEVHYEGSGADGGILHQDAGDLAALLERSYELFVTQLGYPAPMNDGDGRTDVYVVDLADLAILGAAFSDNFPALQASGYLYVDDEKVRSAETIAHEFFHLIQIGQWQPMDRFVMEGSAEWAGFRFVNFAANVDAGAEEPTPLGETLASPDQSLTCPGGGACGFTGYESEGYSRWHFYQYVTERFGGQPVKDIFAKAKALDDATLTGGDILTQYFIDKGTTLANVFGDWTVANLNGNYQAAGLKGVAPVTYSTTLTGSDSGSLAAQKIAVNHLATRYVAFQRGSGSTGPCYPATLNVTVTIPAGVGARPYYHWNAEGSTPIPLAISGSTASVSVPWDTCNWGQRGVVSLPNPSTTIDAAIFTVNATITVDRTKITTSTPPPAPTYTGPTVPAPGPTAEEAPEIALYGPETLRVSRKKRVLRLVVFSSGDGKLDTQLGALGLGMRTLRTGNNDLRFTLPKTALRSLSATSTLTVTSLSPGGTRGASVSRKLQLTK